MMTIITSFWVLTSTTKALLKTITISFLTVLIMTVLLEFRFGKRSTINLEE